MLLRLDGRGTRPETTHPYSHEKAVQSELSDRKNPDRCQFGLLFLVANQVYFLAGGKSVQLPCATSAAMPMLSPSVGCG